MPRTPKPRAKPLLQSSPVHLTLPSIVSDKVASKLTAKQEIARKKLLLEQQLALLNEKSEVEDEGDVASPHPGDFEDEGDEGDEETNAPANTQG